MGADFVERHLPALQQLHKERARDVEDTRRVLRGQLRMNRDDADRIVLTDFGQDVHE